MRKVKVNLGSRSYPIHIGNDLLSQLGKECSRFGFAKRCAVITDSNVEKRYAKATLRSLKAAGFNPILISLPPGETSKSLKNAGVCYDRLSAHRLERNSFVVALGGGVVGDLAGFVAATHLRGIGFVQVPTTLLAQVDSSVGGKVGINLKAGKNLVGAFYQPRFVLCDLKTLDSLPAREFRAGMAEVIKYGIIHDAKLFHQLERNLARILKRDPILLASTIARCCEIKAKVVSEDETESGLRAILNFGHTIGHAIEATAGYGKFLHGEAIAIGQVAAALISKDILNMPKEDVVRVQRIFSAVELPTTIRLNDRSMKNLFDAMLLDKKVSEGTVTFVLARRIGQVVSGQKVPVVKIKKALQYCW